MRFIASVCVCLKLKLKSETTQNIQKLTCTHTMLRKLQLEKYNIAVSWKPIFIFTLLSLWLKRFCHCWAFLRPFWTAYIPSGGGILSYALLYFMPIFISCRLVPLASFCKNCCGREMWIRVWLPFFHLNSCRDRLLI